MLQEVQATANFLPYLFRGAENVSVVLLEPPDSSEARKGSWQFVSVQHSEIRKPKGQLPPRTNAIVKDQARKYRY